MHALRFGFKFDEGGEAEEEGRVEGVADLGKSMFTTAIRSGEINIDASKVKSAMEKNLIEKFPKKDKAKKKAPIARKAPMPQKINAPMVRIERQENRSS